MKSMTGYGSSEHNSQTLDLSINVRSVNGRFLDVRMHTPREYSSIENDLKKIVSQYISRGTVDIYMSRKLIDGGSQARVTLRKDLAKKWVQSMRQLGKELKLAGDLNIETLAHLPFLTRVDEDYSLKASEKKIAFEVLKNALMACDKERNREGKATRKHLQELMKDLLGYVQEIDKLRSGINKQLQAKVTKKIKNLIDESRVDNERVMQEVAFLVDKSDITEEVTRLKEHIKSCSKLMTSQASIGKKLDFYSQELLREVNTIGSKAGHSGITSMVVDSKNVIERFREQVQNIE